MSERLVLDIGNSRIATGLFDSSSLQKKWYHQLSELEKEYEVIKEVDSLLPVVISSVVPSSSGRIMRLLKENGFVNTHLIDLANQQVVSNTYPTMGTDRLANLAAAHKIHGQRNQSTIVIDFGTATTLSAIDESGKFIGGAITLGLKKTLQAVNQNLEQLPILDVHKEFEIDNLNPLALNTDESIFNGTMLGHIAMVHSWISNCHESIESEVKTIATGGLANIIAKHIESIDCIDLDLTLKGINIIGAQVMGQVDPT